MDGTFIVIALVLGLLGSLGSLACYAVIGVFLVKGLKGQLGQWSSLSDQQKADLVRRLSGLSSHRRVSMRNEYLPRRDEVAMIAAQNGIDPGFLYR